MESLINQMKQLYENDLSVPTPIKKTFVVFSDIIAHLKQGLRV
jgi:hypothetical protein